MQGKTISGYTLQRLLGTGGMAEVWYAESKIGTKAAVKIMSEKLSHDDSMQERFLNEAKVMVMLDHPNIRKVYGFDEIDGRPAIVMEYLDGSDLKARMKGGQHFTQEELEKWWNQLADALNYTHAQDIIHRDIKPSNIFIDQRGNAKLLDFGIAKVADTTTGTQTGSTLGTRIYMSPEQVRDPKRVGPPSDVYSLAVSFVHLLTGKAPYDSSTSSDYDIQESIVRKPVDLSKVPDTWRGFLLPYLEKDPAKRPALRAFEVVPQTGKPETSQTPSSGGFAIRPTGDGDLQSPTDDEGTLVNNTPKNQEPHRQEPKKTKPMAKTEPKVEGDKPKSKKGLWIGLGAIAVAAIVTVLLWPRDPYKKIDQWLNESDRIFNNFLETTMADYTNDIAQLNKGYDYCFRASQELSGMENKVPEEWMPRMYRCDSLDADYVQKISAFVEHELNNLSAEQDTAAVISRLRQLEEFGYIKMNVDGNGILDRIETEIGLWRNPIGSTNGHEWVYLGLPSGTLWATCNVGASKPEDYGNYYAWGETNTKTAYNWETYKYADGDKDKLTKYCNSSSYGNNGFTDNLTTLQSGDDPAAAWGSGWHTPDKEQWDELLENTTHQWTTRNGTGGRLFTSKKNGQTLFLPAAGYRYDSSLDYAGSNGYYWSSSLYADYPNYAWYFYFYSVSYYMSSYYRLYGQSVRPVCSSRQN